MATDARSVLALKLISWMFTTFSIAFPGLIAQWRTCGLYVSNVTERSMGFLSLMSWMTSAAGWWPKLIISSGRYRFHFANGWLVWFAVQRCVTE